MAGQPMTATRKVEGAGVVRVRIARQWPSGLYFARLQQGSLIGYAPFVVRAATPGIAHVLVVLPTNTWQAYNFRDGNGDSSGDTWYANSSVHTVSLDRPYLQRGVPPHYREYDSGFIHWLSHSGNQVDVVSDDDLERIGQARTLAAHYRLIVFPGHEEYVTPHVYDLIERYRDLGGNLALLSANNFFYRVTRSGSTLVGRERWRDLGRPEERLLGSQYVTWFDWDHAAHPNAPYTVVGAKIAPWLFGPAGLHDGDRFGRFGIEVDARGPTSPPGTAVLAEIPGIFGYGKNAQMTLYRSPHGGYVFSAGVLNFGGSALQPPVSRLLDALWAHLGGPAREPLAATAPSAKAKTGR